ncbi:MAG: RluA family pseudouridine synthase [Saprospiraceae bacterium]|nr:RluA family pseudouridine synthase [Saprospiraceae bacterium]
MPWESEQEDEQETREIHLRVDPGQSSIRVDSFIQDKLGKVSRSKIQNAIENGLVSINGHLIKSNYKVRPNDLIDIVLPAQVDHSKVIPENIPLDILYEDEDVLLVNKAPGMVVHPAHGNYTGTLVNAIAGYFNLDPEDPKTSRYGLVHRIDKETSGILILAKNEFSHVHLAKQFFDHTIDREYLALVWGEPKEKEGTIEANLGRDPKNRQKMYAFADGSFGKHAVTHYQIVETFYYTSLIRCKLETGRTHQIRIHLKLLGHPLFNDEKYGGEKIHKGTLFSKYKQFIQNCYKLMPRFPLHAKSLAFTHPVTGERMKFEVPLPEDFQELLEKWRKYLNHRKDGLEDDDSISEVI